MLPGDTKLCRQATIDQITQLTVTDHFKPETEEDRLIVYSNKGFVSIAIEWLIDANLVSLFQTSILYCTYCFALS